MVENSPSYLPRMQRTRQDQDQIGDLNFLVSCFITAADLGISEKYDLPDPALVWHFLGTWGRIDLKGQPGELRRSKCDSSIS